MEGVSFERLVLCITQSGNYRPLERNLAESLEHCRCILSNANFISCIRNAILLVLTLDLKLRSEGDDFESNVFENLHLTCLSQIIAVE